MSQTIDLVISEGVAHLTLTRPESANAFDLPTATAFGQAVDQIADSSDVRAVVLSGQGKRFCAGGDVASFDAADDPQAYIRELADVLDGAMQRFAALPVATVVAVQGAAAGAGLSVMLGADVIVAARSTKFVTAYASIGLTPDVGLSWLLPRAIGQVRALDLLLTGRVLDGPTALDWGLVTELTDDDPLVRAQEIAATIASGPAQALGQARRLVRNAWSTSRSEAGDDESRTIADRVGTEEAQELIGAFLAPGR
ncbi:MAG: enoyl-CoA hydratase/isomerase family protein [Aeromicrobium sp.]|uniref:enoyl-CoA hydratase/isomerase family protein n=1 Tax=Aeromicrobium sp. TaxID=1871063 RepID=UPI0026039A64|nr:enoyl-CoA hydratase/isomerase family protein [Aeromicrobium sp.]MDF1705312.1 enoyl-CoA hydratase/isomerase family protein [Aeromicrobium sp.]